MIFSRHSIGHWSSQSTASVGFGWNRLKSDTIVDISPISTPSTEKNFPVLIPSPLALTASPLAATMAAEGEGGQGVSVYRGPAGQGARGDIMPFSSSPQRWEILTACTVCSLHRLSDTRWSARVDSVKPIAAHLPGIMKALERVQELNLTPETRSNVMA